MYSIAIDGPVSSGKSSVAEGVAKRLGILHLNTGELYRAIGYFAYKNKVANVVDDQGMPQLSENDVAKLTQECEVGVEFIDGKQHTFVNGEDVTKYLHTPLMSDYSSRVSVIPSVRDHVLDLQREIAKQQNVVMEGRDITSHVLPDSKYKFYITADAKVRAIRRQHENISKGIQTDFEQVLADVELRDKRDMTRKVCPLVIVKDAIVIDTSNLEIDEVVQKIVSYVEEK